MAYIWHTDINGDIELHEDAIKLLPEMRKLGKKLTKFIVLYKDYRLSPIKDFPETQRLRLATIKSGHKEQDAKKIIGDERVVAAMIEFESLIYDERRELKEIYKNRLELLKKEIRSPSLDLKQMKEKKDFIDFFRSEIKRIDGELSNEHYDDDAIDIKGKRKLSYIERWQRRKKQFEEMSYA